MHSQLNEQLFTKKVVIQLPWLKTSALSILPFFYFKLKKQNKTGSIMDICSTDHIAGKHVLTDRTCIVEEPQQKSTLERSVIDYWGS